MSELYCESEAETEAEKAFVRAVTSGSALDVRDVLTKFEEVRAKIDYPWFAFDAPAIVRASSSRDRDKIDVLLEFGADIDARSSWAAGPYSALHHCVDGPTDEKLRFADFLIERGATIDLHAAAGLGRIDIIRDALDREPGRVVERGPDGCTPLHLAKNTEVANLLLERGADVSVRCIDHKSTPAMWHLKSHPEVSRRLVEAGGPVDVFMAAALGEISLIDRCLSKHPASIGARIGIEPWTDFTGGGDKYIWVLGLYRSPHAIARTFDQPEAFRHLMERSPADIAFVESCEAGDRSTARKLLAADPNLARELPRERARALADAAWEGRTEAVRVMLEVGFDCHVVGDHDSTPLDRAAFHGYREIVELLLEHDPDPPLTKQNEFGGSPLGTCLYGRLNGWVKGTDYAGTVRALLMAGANYGSDWRPYPDPEIEGILAEYPDAVEEKA